MKELESQTLEAAYEDGRGAIFDILDGEEVRHVGRITSVEGSVRGNHYHQEQKQWMYIVEGAIDLFLKDIRNDEDAEIRRLGMEAGDVVYIPPRVVHTIVAREYTVFLDFNDKERGENGELYEEDTVRVDDISGENTP